MESEKGLLITKILIVAFIALGMAFYLWMTT